MPLLAIHPGEHLAEELKELNMSAASLARQLQVPTNRITQILNGRRDITADTALRLAHFFDTSAEFWINLQGLYDLRIAQQEAGKNYQGPTHPQAHDRRPRIDQLPTYLPTYLPNDRMLDLADSVSPKVSSQWSRGGKVTPTLEILLGVATKFGPPFPRQSRGFPVA